MGFLQPLFLWGLAGISIPIVIHLFSRKKSPPYYFSTLKFIKLTHRKTIRRQKIEEILVLMLRTFLVICLFIAAAQPVSKRLLISGKEHWIILVLDDSASMSAMNENPWIQLQKASEQIIATLKKPSHISVIFTSGKTIPFSTMPENIAIQIRESKPGFHGKTIQNAVEQAFLMLEKKSGYHKIFIITDMQKATWKNFSLQNSKKISPDIAIIDVGEETQAPNLTIKDFYMVPGKGTYVCEIINYGNQQITTQVKIEGDEFQTIKSITVPANSTGEIETKIEKECQSLKAELLYPDSLKSDNTFYLQKDISGQKSVLITGSDETSVFYTKSSVESAGTAVDIRNTNELYDIILEKYRAIIMVDPVRIKPEIRKKIIEYVRSGGTLIYFAGDRIATQDFNSDWETEKNEFFMPVKLSEKNEFLKPRRTGWVATGHPLFFEFGEKAIDFLKTTIFNACYSTTHITGDILMKLDNGSPLLCEKRMEKGKIFLFTFSPQKNWTNFQTKPIFPVMMAIMIEHLSGSVSSISVGDSVVVRGSENVDTVNIVNPAGKVKVLNANKNIPVSFIPDIPGIWTATFSSKDGQQKQIIAANVPATEGDLSKISYGNIRQGFKKSRISFIKKEQIEKLIVVETTAGHLTMFFLQISLMLLLAELILSNMLVFIKEKKTKNVQTQF